VSNAPDHVVTRPTIIPELSPMLNTGPYGGPGQLIAVRQQLKSVPLRGTRLPCDVQGYVRHDQSAVAQRDRRVIRGDPGPHLPGRGGLQPPQPVGEYRLAGVRRGGLP